MNAVAPAAEAIRCPAGAPVEGTPRGPACYCRIARDLITRDANSRSLVTFCSGPQTDSTGYENCPVWRRDREQSWKHNGRRAQAEIDRTAPDPRPG